MKRLKLGYKDCKSCGKKIRLNVTRDIKRKKFCCRSCSTKWNIKYGNAGMKGRKHSEESKIKMSSSIDRSMENNGNWKGGLQNCEYKRRVIKSKRVVLEHRRVMEEHIGRPLTSEEIVHHIDYNKHNNNITNLMLCKDKAEHRKQHAYGTKRIRETLKNKCV